jgi:hypothetical protein
MAIADSSCIGGSVVATFNLENTKSGLRKPELVLGHDIFRPTFTLGVRAGKTWGQL